MTLFVVISPEDVHRHRMKPINQWPHQGDLAISIFMQECQMSLIIVTIADPCILVNPNKVSLNADCREDPHISYDRE